MGLTERRLSRGASLQAPLRHSLGGRKQDVKHLRVIKITASSVALLVMAAIIAVLGIWHVETMRITSSLLHLHGSYAASHAADASNRLFSRQQVSTRQDRSPVRSSGTSATAAVHLEQYNNIASAPFPDELPAIHPQPIQPDADDSVHTPSQASDFQQPATQAAASTASTPSVQFPVEQQQAYSTPSRTGSQSGTPSPHLSAALPKNRLLLSTHSRLMWYFPDTDEYLVLHEGEGVHYGAFPGGMSEADATTVWTAIRPHNWRPTTNKEYLVEFDMVTGVELRRVAIPSRFTHDIVRADDSIFVCDTGNGRILQLKYPEMFPVRSMDLFTLKDHPNTLAPLAPDNFLVVLHNLGQSDIVRVNISATPFIQNPQAWLAQESQKLQQPGFEPVTSGSQSGFGLPDTTSNSVLGKVQRVGEKAHGLVPWQGAYIMLDSDNGALMALDLTGAANGKGFTLHKLWQAPEKGVFLKGLAVVDDIAYFGISPWAPRSARDDPQSNNQLAAFDLISGLLLWRRTVPTAGLLNTVSAPHLSFGSTYLPSYTGRPESEAVKRHHSSHEVATVMRGLNEMGYPPKVGGYWSSGLPFLDTTIKGSARPWEGGLQLPLLMMNISKLQAAVAALPPEAWTYEYQAKYSAVMAGREGNLNAFKPGVTGIVLLFSANDGHGPVFKFPAYDYFNDALEPLLEEIVGKRDMQHIIRLQLALMKPGVSDIKIHVDSGGYAIRGHRLHIPVFTHPEVSFDVCPHRYVPDPEHKPGPGEEQRTLDIQECYKIPTVEGFAFELNNRVAHKVSNLSPVERVHVVIDLCEEPHPRVDVPIGTVCDYDVEKGLLCKYPDGMTPAVMNPATFINPAAAAAESTVLPPEQQQQWQQQQDAYDGTGYSSQDDTIKAPTPDAGAPALPSVNYERITHPETAAAAAAAHGSAGLGDIAGTVTNGRTSTWITEAMHTSHGALTTV